SGKVEYSFKSQEAFWRRDEMRRYIHTDTTTHTPTHTHTNTHTHTHTLAHTHTHTNTNTHTHIQRERERGGEGRKGTEREEPGKNNRNTECNFYFLHSEEHQYLLHFPCQRWDHNNTV